MSLNSGSFDEKLYESRRQEAIRQVQETIKNAQEWGEKPVSDEEFQKLAEENLKNQWNSLEWWQFIKRTKMYVWREKLLAEEIQKLKDTSKEENMKQAEKLMHELKGWKNKWKLQIDVKGNSDWTPVFFNTFKKK